jgi:hypothetical protein
VINDAYAKLLPKENGTIPIPQQFLCPYSNISACLPIEGQDQVRKIQLTQNGTRETVSILFVVHIDTLESNHSSGNNPSSCACHSAVCHSFYFDLT